MSHFPGFRKGIFQFVPDTLDHPLFFLITNLLFLLQKIGQKTEKNLFFDQFQTVLSTFSLFLPQNYGPGSLFYQTPQSVMVLSWISQNFIFMAYPNQKLWKKNLWEGQCASLSIQSVKSTPRGVQCTWGCQVHQRIFIT